MALGAGYDVMPSGYNPLTNRFYVAGQNVPLRGKPPIASSTGVRPPPKPIANPYVDSGKAVNKKWQIPRGEMDQLLGQYQNEVAGLLPNVGGYTLQDIANALGMGAPAASGGSSGGARRSGRGSGGGGVMPKFSDIQSTLANASTNIGGAYSTAGAELAKLMGEYAAADAARRAASGQTLQAFGAPASSMDVGGMSAMDVLAALRGQLTGQQAMQQSDIEQQLAAYKALLGGK